MSCFDEAFALTLNVEGDFSDHPQDRGGPTRYGITELVARAHGFESSMAALPLDVAKQIAKAQYWDLLRLDDVAAIDDVLALELFDTAYNMGVGTAGKFLQRALNVLNRGARDFPDLEVDGIVGPITLARLRAYLALRQALGAKVLVVLVNAFQACRYAEICEQRPANEAFMFGWIANRVGG